MEESRFAAIAAGQRPPDAMGARSDGRQGASLMDAPAAAAHEPRQHYHPVGIAIHWTMAALIAFQLAWGWRTTLMAPGFDKLAAYEVHALIGLAIFTLAFLRAGWRIFEAFALPDMEKPEDLPGWQRSAAETTHFGLFAPERSATFHSIALFLGYAALQGLVSVALLRLFPAAT